MTPVFSWLSAHRRGLSVVALLVTTVVAATYLSLGALQNNPLRSTYTVRVELDQSGGLLAGRDVTVRGVRVGRVQSLTLSGGTIVATAEIDSGTRISRQAPVRVSDLSAAGEQYLDFAPTTSAGPYLHQGSVVSTRQSSTPVSLATTLQNASGVLAQMDPEKLHAIVQELGTGPMASQKLADIIDGGSFLINTLHDVLPQTASLLRNSAIVGSTVRDVGPGLQETAAGLDRTITGVEKTSDGFVRLVNIGPQMVRLIDQLVADNSPTMVSLLGSLVSTAQVLQLREPAIRHLFFPVPRRGSAADAIASIFHEGKIWAFVNLYPRKDCTYDVPQPPTALAQFNEPYKYVDCSPQDYGQLVRGLRNVPLPPGVQPGPLPGDSPLATTSPTPRGIYSIPLPDGGLRAPIPVPQR